MNDNKKWLFRSGLHNGTLMSRDSDNPVECDSFEECKRKATVFKENISHIGYKVWFCDCVSPNGERIELLPSVPYW